jgi:RNA polymerase sigma-70 factor (ECF subfamily)
MQRIEKYLARLYRYAFSLAREEELAKDLVQISAVKSLSAKSVPGDESAYRAWLFVILRNAFLDHVRRDRVADAFLDQEPKSVPTMEYWDGDERLINILNVKQAIARLRPADQEIIGLVDMAGLSYAEASQVLGVPVGTVMSRISRARSRLLDLVERSNVEPLALRRERKGRLRRDG